METATTAVLLTLLGLAAIWANLPTRHRTLPAWAERAWRRWRARRSGPEPPPNRAIEEIAAHVRRLGPQFHNLPPRASLAKVNGIRSAYDGALAECCEALGVPQLLGLLPPGPDRDVERRRVEIRLADAGFDFPDAA